MYIRDFYSLNKACKSIAKVMIVAVQALGCKAYHDSRLLACECSSDYSNNTTPSTISN